MKLKIEVLRNSGMVEVDLGYSGVPETPIPVELELTDKFSKVIDRVFLTVQIRGGKINLHHLPNDQTSAELHNRLVQLEVANEMRGK